MTGNFSKFRQYWGVASTSRSSAQKKPHLPVLGLQTCSRTPFFVFLNIWWQMAITSGIIPWHKPWSGRRWNLELPKQSTSSKNSAPLSQHLQCCPFCPQEHSLWLIELSLFWYCKYESTHLPRACPNCQVLHQSIRFSLPSSSTLCLVWLTVRLSQSTTCLLAVEEHVSLLGIGLGKHVVPCHPCIAPFLCHLLL